MPRGLEGGQLQVPGGQREPQPRDLERGQIQVLRVRESVDAPGEFGGGGLQGGAERRRHLQRAVQRDGGQQDDDANERFVEEVGRRSLRAIS